MSNLISVASVTEIEGEPRILDTILAARLGYKQPFQIRELIARNRDELLTFGGLSCGTINPNARGGRPAQAYLLNEGQALVLCALSRTPKATEIRKVLIQVFQDYRAGKLVHVNEHNRRPPAKRKSLKGYDEIYNCLKAFKDKPDALLQVLAHTIERVEALEAARST